MLQLGYFSALGGACLLACWIAYKAYQNRDATGARPLGVVALATVVWAGGSLGLALSTDPGAELRWLQASYLGMTAAPVAFFLFALEYTGSRTLLTFRTVAPLVAAGGAFLGLVWTNPHHNLYWAGVEYTAVGPADIATTPAIGFWGFVLFTYALLLAGSFLFLRYALTAPDLYRDQTVAILTGVAAPWAANIPHVLQVMTLDLTPVALAVTTGALWTALSRYQLADLGPVALRTVFDSIAAGVCVVDSRGRVVDVNAAGRNMLDAPSDVIGVPVQKIVPNDAFYEHVQEADGERSILSVGTSPPDRSPSATRYYEIRVSPLTLSRGGEPGRLIVVNDVTTQHRQQEQLKNQNERLEAFTSVVSHDLRNPLNVASGNVMLARENGTGDHLERAERALQRMATLIDDLLALAHGGTAVTDPEPVSVAAVAADAWQTVDTQAATLIRRTEHTILSDRSRLHQLIENLVRNAVEHGGKSVTIVIGDRADGFYVADDGPGIPEEERDAVFETGYSTRDSGTGFGLNIAREIADAHGWDIHITESAAGGTRFDLTGVVFAEGEAYPPS